MNLDVLDSIESELTRAREEVARAVERLDCFTDIRSIAMEVTGRLGTPMADMTALMNCPVDSITRARLDNLVARLAATIKETTP